MQDSSIPAKFPIPWANGAGGSYVRPIPTASQIGITPGAASLTDGFPPATFTPTGSGGTPPFGADTNGILKQITQWLQWEQAGGPVQYDSAFSASIGGYMKGSILANASTLGSFWISTVDNNTSNPDTGGANWTGYSVTGGGAGGALGPGAGAGQLTISGATTLTTGQLGYFVEITGGSTYVTTIPAPTSIAAHGYALNNVSSANQTIGAASGTFYVNNVTASTITLPPGGWALIWSDGTNWFALTSALVATTTAYGVGRVATVTEGQNGVTSGIAPAFMTPEDTAAAISTQVPVATTTTRGIGRVATNTEAVNGVTSGSVPAFMTPEDTAAAVAALAANPWTTTTVGSLIMGSTANPVSSTTNAWSVPGIGAAFTATAFSTHSNTFGNSGGGCTVTDQRITSGAFALPGTWTVISTMSTTPVISGSVTIGICPYLVILQRTA